MKKTILVIGATGMLGQPVVKLLKKDGFDVRIFTRNKSKASKIFNNKFEIYEGDFLNKESLKKAMEGSFGVHINISGENEQKGVENIVEIASQKGIERITYISGTTVSEENTYFPQTKRKYLAEKTIKESGIPYTIFCPAWFMESLSKYVRGKLAFVFGKQSTPYHFVAAEDYARMVSTSYKLEEAKNKRFFIHGPESILFHEALKQYCSVLHPEIKKITTIPYWLANIIAKLKGSKEMRFASELMKYFEKVGELGNPAEANNILGAPETTLKDWLNKKKKKYRENS